ncbi:hypothetical protein K503DRAFT_720231 [Rhizopogon vinicolor AM-OR11-026]|uniref:PWWP domain-containing protein n=1 Tax=Rhizopogon vinicolor AM-OR11-026 TaxID=1314800 RepID=A0A1B7MWX2_9AGAM|nr:hypothetical protein K503DRAFT_720231 [Rhizopogon vinicolor AM-OR11-026]
MATTSPMLSERILPTRRAAKVASAVFADQLQNSPGRSDDEPEPSDSFGEPASRRQPSVKYRYNAKGKFRASPLKQTDSPSPSPKRQPKAKPKRKPKPMTPSHSQSSMHSKKRKASASLSDREDTVSTLTALSPSPFSSLPPSPRVPNKNLPQHSNTPLQKLSTRGGSMRSIGKSSSKATSFSQPLSRSSSKKKKADNAKSSGQVNERRFGDVDTLVWVLVNDSGVVVTTVEHDDDDIELLEEQMWWPARIVQKEPLRVTFFGDLALSREPSTITSPSESNVKPIHNLSGEKNFSRATFQVSSLSSSESSNPPPRKKTKTDICERWEAAVKALEHADELKRDGMPEMISAYTGGTFSSEDEDVDDFRGAAPGPPSQGSKAGKGKGKAKVAPRDEFEVPTDRAWSPPPADPTLQLPGELVLAQAPRTRGNKYWPAQLLSYVPPTKPGGKERYRAKFLDDQEYDLNRDKFWTSEEQEFITCDMGEFESAVQDIEAPDSENERDELEDGERSPTPQLADSPPVADDFADLPMRAQLAYVRPVLKAILQGKYIPASKKHEAFMRGGVARSSLMKRAAVRGGLDPNEVKQSQRLISRWALGEGYARRVKRGIEPLVEVVQLPEQGTALHTIALAANGDGLAKADTKRADETSATSDRVGHDGLPQPIPPSDVGNQADATDAMEVDKPDQPDASSDPTANELHHASLQHSKSCTAASVADGDGLAEAGAGSPDKISATSEGIGNDIMSQPIPLSDIRNQVDDDSMAANQADEPSELITNESLHGNARSATNLTLGGLADEISDTLDSTGDDGKSQPIPLSDIGNQVDDADAMAVDRPVKADDSPESKINELPPAPSHDQPPAAKEDTPEQSDLTSIPDLSVVGEVESCIPPLDQQRPVGSQEYEALSTLDKLDYCVNILLPEAIQQLLLWRSGERTSASLLSSEEEERLHERGEAKAQETDWVYDLLHLREAQARLWGVDLKAKGKDRHKSSDAGGGTRLRPRRATILR